MPALATILPPHNHVAVLFPAAAIVPQSVFERLLRTYQAERDALVRKPETTLAEWEQFRATWATRVPWQALDANEMARAIFAGLADSPSGRVTAEQRLDTILASSSAMTAARLTGARVRLSRNAESSRQAAVLHTFLVHPGMAALIRSLQAAEVLEAVLSVSSSETLSAQSDDMRTLFALLGDAPAPTLALYGQRVSFLIPLTFTDPKSRTVERQRWLETLQKARAKLTTQENALIGELDAAIRRLQADLLPVTGPSQPSATLRPADAAPLIWNALRLGTVSSATLRLTSRSLEPHPDSLFGAIHDNDQRTTTLRVMNAVTSDSPDRTASILRAFGGIQLRDPALSLRTDDIGIYREKPGSGFVNRFTLSATGYRFSMDRLQVFPNDTRIQGMTIAANLDRYRWAEIRARSLEWEPDEPGSRKMEVRTLTLHALGLRLLTIPKVRFRVGAAFEDSEQNSTANDTPAKPSTMQARNDLFRLPSIGFSEGGLTIGYTNAFKFPPHLTGDLRFRTYADRRPYTDLSLNYNLRAVTPYPDRLLDMIDLQENSLGSFYYKLTTQDVMRDNRELFQRKLIAGIGRIDNQLFTQPDGTTEALDMPFGASLEGVTFLPDLIGLQMRTVAARVSNRNFGTSDRLTTSLIVGPPTFRLGRGLRFTLRGEGTNDYYGGGNGHYWWYRGIAGLSALIVPGARFSLAAIRSREAGTPLLPSDQVPADNYLVVRSDMTLGTVYLGLMDRYSDRENRFNRFQAIVSLRVGVLEPYLRYDRRFQSVGFGVFVKVEDYVSRFGRRRVEQLTAERQLNNVQ